MILFYLAASLIASILLACGLLLMKKRAKALPRAHGLATFAAVAAWIRDPTWFGGLALETAGYALYLVALAGAPVSLAAVAMQVGVGLFVLTAVLMLGERASLSEWMGIVGLLVAAVMLGLSLDGTFGRDKIEPRALLALSFAVVLAGLAPAAASKLRQNGTAEAIASGLAFGLGALYTKAMVEAIMVKGNTALAAVLFLGPYPYLSIAANVCGLVMLQNAFGRARGIIAMPLSSALSNVIPILGGLSAFGERLPAAPPAAAERLAAFALTIIAAALLSATQAPEAAETK
jgi:uncharacterized membrane protein